MERHRLAPRGPRGVQAPKTDLSSILSQRRKDGSQTSTATDRFPCGDSSSRATSNAGERGQAHIRNRRNRFIKRPGETGTCPRDPAEPVARNGPTGPSGLDSQAWQYRIASVGNSRHGRPRPADVSQDGTGTGMGGSLRAEQFRISSRARMPRCDCRTLRSYPSGSQVRLGCRHRKVFRPYRP
jgi:hypothetical protein